MEVREKMLRCLGGGLVSMMVVRFLDTVKHTLFVEHYSVLHATYGQIQSKANSDMLFMTLEGLSTFVIMYLAMTLKKKR